MSATLLLGAPAQADDAPVDLLTTVKAAKAAVDAGDLAGADRLVHSVIAAAQTARDQLRVAATLTIIGEAYSYAGELAPALADLQLALPMSEPLGKPDLIGEILSSLATVDIGLHRPADALVAARRARDIHHGLADRSNEALDLHGMATADEQLGQYAAALDADQSALTLYTQLTDPKGKLLALAGIGLLQHLLGHPTDALTAYQSALEIAHMVGPPATEASLLRGEAATFADLNDAVRERDALAQARAIYQAQRDAEDESQVLFALGFVDTSLEHLDAAAADYESEVAIDRARGNRQHIAESLESLGGAYLRLYRYDDALRAENEALRIDTDLRIPPHQTTTLNEIGLIQTDRGHYAEALDAYSRALALVRISGSRLGLADALNNMGNVYEDQGLHARAAAAIAGALAAARAAGNADAQAAAELNAAGIDDALGRREVALHDFDAALTGYQALHNRRGEATALAGRGALFGRLGRNREALADLDASRSIVAVMHDRRVEATTYANIAYVEARLGQYDAALADDQAALAIARTIGDRHREATALANIALLDEARGEVGAALSLDLDALSIDRSIGDRHGVASVLGGLSTVYRRQGRSADALAAAREELAQMKALADPAGEAAADGSIAVAYGSAGRCTDEIGPFQAALAIAQQTGDRQTAAATLGSLADTQRCLKHWKTARSQAQRAAALAKGLANPTVFAGASFTMAVADANSNAREPAMREAEIALATLDGLRPGLTSTADRSAYFSNSTIAVDFDWYTQYVADLAVRWPGRGFDRRAFDVFERRQGWALLDEFGSAAARRYSGVPADISANDLELTRRIAAVRTDLAQLRSSALPDRAAIDAGQAQLTTLLRQSSELQARIQRSYPHYYELEHPQSIGNVALQHDVLRPGEVLFAYDVLPGGVILWVVDRTHFTMLRLPHSERIPAMVAAFVRAMNDDVTTRGESAQGLGFALYDLLVPPAVRPLVGRATSMVIVPSGDLFKLPWEALLTRDPAKAAAAPHYLIEDRAISYVPSATFLALGRATGGQTRHAQNPLLAFANPDFAPPASAIPASAAPFAQAALAAFNQSAANVPVFAPLPGTQTEADAVRLALRAAASDEHTGDDASRATLLALDAAGALRTYRYVMFATHALIPDDRSAVEPALILAHPQTDGKLTLSDVLGLTLGADFVALSACKTGDGVHPAGEGISGLTRAFLYAGTPAISVTLWDAADAVGPLLSPAFFAAMQAGASPAQALRSAKLGLIHGTDPLLGRPYFWAPTVIFGDGDAP